MTTAQILWRLTWKEYRVQRALWWMVLILALIAEGLTVNAMEFLAQLGFLKSAPLTSSGLLVVTFVAVAIYLVGCGATMFAWEHEQGEIEFQRFLPTSLWASFAVKIGAGYLSGLALGCVLLVPTILLPVGVLGQTAFADWWAGMIMFTEFFLWSVFFSRMLRDPLRAAVCGVFVASIVECAVFPLLTQQAWTDDFLVFHRGSLGPRSLAALTLLLANAWLARHWLPGVTLPSWLRFPRGLLPQNVDLVLYPANGTIPKYLGGRRTGFWHLVTIAWRQGKWIWTASVSLFAAALIATLANPSLGDLLVMAWIISLIVHSWCSFGLDQRGDQFRFYAERGVDPKWLWLSRHVVWFTPLLLMALIVEWNWFGINQPSQSGIESFRQHIQVVVAVMAYSVGQFWAMAIRRVLVALVMILFSTLALFCWLLLMVMGDVPLWLSSLPFPVVCLHATWHFGGNWLEERRGRWNRREVLAMFGIPVVIVLPAIAAYRVYSIPASSPVVDVSEYTRPLTASEQHTLSLYTQAHQELLAAAREANGEGSGSASSESPSHAPSRHARAMDLLRKAHQRPRVPVTMTPKFFGGEPMSKLGDFDAGPMVDLVRREASHLTSQGKLAETWQAFEIAFELLERIRLRGGERNLLLGADYQERVLLQDVVEWANHRDQTSAMLEVAQRRLAEWDQDFNSGQDTTSCIARSEFARWTLMLDGDWMGAVGQVPPPPVDSALRVLRSLMPWEVARARRVVGLMVRQYGHAIDADELNRLKRMRESTPWLLLLMPGREQVIVERLGYQSANTERSATRILVAIIAWRREHQGKLPDRLRDLAGTFLDSVPVDVSTGDEFFYSAHGTDREIRDQVKVQPSISMPSCLIDAASNFEDGSPNGQLAQTALLLPKGTGFLWLPRDTHLRLKQQPTGEVLVSAELESAIRDATLRTGLLWLIPPYQAPSPRP